MSWFAYTTLWTASLGGIIWVLAENPWLRLGLLLGLGAAYLALLVLGAMFPRLHFYFIAVNRGTSEEGCVALTFDDGPDPKVTPKLLEVLKREEVEAAFFMVGRAVKANPAQAKRVAAAGHLICNHSFEHSPFWPFKPVFALRSELNRAQEALAEVAGHAPRFVRMPFSAARPGLRRMFRKLRLIPVGWDVRGLEGLQAGPEAVAERVARQARNGSIILLHECYYGTRAFSPEAVAETARLVIARLRERGFVFKRLDDMLGMEGYLDEA